MKTTDDAIWICLPKGLRKLFNLVKYEKSSTKYDFWLDEKREKSEEDAHNPNIVGRGFTEYVTQGREMRQGIAHSGNTRDKKRSADKQADTGLWQRSVQGGGGDNRPLPLDDAGAPGSVLARPTCERPLPRAAGVQRGAGRQHTLMMARNKWTDVQRHRINTLFQQYPLLKQAYDLSMELRHISNSPFLIHAPGFRYEPFSLSFYY